MSIAEELSAKYKTREEFDRNVDSHHEEAKRLLIAQIGHDVPDELWGVAIDLIWSAVERHRRTA